MTALRRLAASQPTRFLVVGALNTVFGYLAFVALELAFGESLHYLLVLLGAHVVGVLFSFHTQRRYVFRVQGQVLTDLARFWSVNLVVLGANVLALPLLVEVLGAPVIPAQGLFTAVMVVGTYLGHRNFSFRRAEA